jgi:hypothetical protein
MGATKVVKPNDQASRPVNIKDGTLSRHASGSPGHKQGDTEKFTQPVGSYVRFARIGKRPVFYEVLNGKYRNKAKHRLCPVDEGRNYYQVGDVLRSVKATPTKLKEYFPSAPFAKDDISIWEVLDAMTGGDGPDEYQVGHRIDAISLNVSQPWEGEIQITTFAFVEDDLVHIPRKPKETVWRAGANSGQLNYWFGANTATEGLDFLVKFIEIELEIVREVLLTIAGGQLLRIGKHVFRVVSGGKKLRKIAIVKNIAKWLKKIDQKAVLRAAKEFAKEFTKSLGLQIKTFTLKQLAGKEAKIKYEDAITKGSVAFVDSLLISTPLAKPLARLLTKDIGGKEYRKAFQKHIEGIVTHVGHAMYTDAIAAAATKTINEKSSGKTYEDHLIDELQTRLVKLMTLDVFSGVLKTMAEDAKIF